MDAVFFLLIVLAGWLAIGALGGYIGAARGHRGLGIALGLLLGPIGCIIAAILPQRSARGSSHTGSLSLEDDYYDLQARTWLPVASMPWL